MIILSQRQRPMETTPCLKTQIPGAKASSWRRIYLKRMASRSTTLTGRGQICGASLATASSLSKSSRAHSQSRPTTARIFTTPSKPSPLTPTTTPSLRWTGNCWSSGSMTTTQLKPQPGSWPTSSTQRTSGAAFKTCCKRRNLFAGRSVLPSAYVDASYPHMLYRHDRVRYSGGACVCDTGRVPTGRAVRTAANGAGPQPSGEILHLPQLGEWGVIRPLYESRNRSRP